MPTLIYKRKTESDRLVMIGNVVFIDGETKDANFDTISEPLNLSMFKCGELRMLLEEKTGNPKLTISFGSIDEKTGQFYAEVVSPEIKKNQVGRMAASFLGSSTAIKATLSGGSFKITITGEFKTF